MFTYDSTLVWGLNSRVNVVSSEHNGQVTVPEPTVRGFQTSQKESIVLRGSLSMLKIKYFSSILDFLEEYHITSYPPFSAAKCAKSSD